MKPAFWFIPVVLLALGRQFPRQDRAFTVAELLSWAPELGAPKTVRSACQTLQRNGLLERAPDALPTGLRKPTNPQTWRLTADAWACCCQRRKRAQAGVGSHSPREVGLTVVR